MVRSIKQLIFLIALITRLITSVTVSMQILFALKVGIKQQKAVFLMNTGLKSVGVKH